MPNISNHRGGSYSKC